MKSVEEQLQEVKEQLKAALKEGAAQKEVIAQSQRATVSATLEQKIIEAKLPKASADALRSQFKDSVDAGKIEEAVSFHKSLVNELTTVVKNNGSADNGDMSESDAKKAKENLASTFVEAGLAANIEQARKMAE